ncbi:MAG: GNAT family N-acetyltransferase [Halobacteriales archaeon]|nr:GNAT family N-acetyltransferase [Halobacteriales archaeon]
MRPLTEADLPAAASLLAGEGWTFTPRELRRVLATGPGLSLCSGEPLHGLVMVARHGNLAWIGNVAVAPSHRGRGGGERLVAEALRRIDAAAIATTKLCSVPKAVTLYARHGFAREGTVRTFARVHERPASRPKEAELILPEDVPAMVRLDMQGFRADRTALFAQLVRDYPDTGVAVRAQGELRGFAFLKPGEEGSELGPVVLAEPDAKLAALLLDGALGFRLQGAAMGLECSVMPGNAFLAGLLEERGFQERAQSTLMARGQPLPQDGSRCAALAGLEKG